MVPAWPVFIGAYSSRIVSTCGGVRHETSSAPVHWSTLGSNLQASGFSSTPSFTPSRASQAFSTASWTAGYFAAGMKPSGGRCARAFRAMRADVDLHGVDHRRAGDDAACSRPGSVSLR